MEVDVQNDVSRRIRLATVGLLIAWATLLLLGSWYPFEYQEATFRGACEQWWRGWRLAGQSRSDLAINVVAGVPLGFCSGLLIRVWSTRKSKLGFAECSSGLLALSLIALYAFGVEIGQAWFSHRVPSSLDTFAQIAGASGAMIVSLSLGEFLLIRISSTGLANVSSRSMALLDLYFFGYVIWMWMPFIPALSPSELKQKWLHGVTGLGLQQWSRDPWVALYQAGVAMATAIPIGAWWRRMSSRGLVDMSVWGALLWGGICVVGLELSQLFIQSRVAAIDDCFWSVVGTFVGGAMTRSKSPGGEATPSGGVGMATRFGLLSVCCVVYLAASLAPFDLVNSKAELFGRYHAARERMQAGTLSGNDYAMFTNAFRTFFFTAPVGALFVYVSNTFRPVLVVTLISLIALTVFTAIGEGIQIISKSHSVDAVGFLARLSGGWFGAICYLRWANVHCKV